MLFGKGKNLQQLVFSFSGAFLLPKSVLVCVCFSMYFGVLISPGLLSSWGARERNLGLKLGDWVQVTGHRFKSHYMCELGQVTSLSLNFFI